MGLNTIYNIVNKLIDDNINVLYEPSHSLFDFDIRNISANLYNNSNKYYGYYDIAIINDWQKHAIDRLKFLSEHQIVDLLFFHSLCPENFKKEDKAIFDKTTRTAYKVFLSKDIYDSWCLYNDKSIQINYGISCQQITHYASEVVKNQSILFCNVNNRPEYNNIFQHLKNYYPNLELLNSMQNYDNTIQKICQYPIMIDLQYGIHSLYGIMSGCRVITNQVIDTKLTSPITISNINDISIAINNANTQYNRVLIEKDQKYIIDKYNINAFINSLDTIIQKMKVEPFVI